MHETDDLNKLLPILYDGVLIVQDNKILFANANAAQLLDMSEQEILDGSWQKIFPHTQLQLTLERSLQVSAKRKVLLSNAPMVWQNKPARLIQLHHTDNDMAALESEVLKRTQVLHEVLAEEKKANKKLKMAKEQAEIANQSKNQFLRMVCHEFNTPLNSILGFADLLKYDIPKDKESWLSSLDEIIIAGKRLHESIRDIAFVANLELGLVQIDEGVVELSALLESCIASMDKKDIQIANNIDQQLCCVADANHLRKIFSVLLENAVVYNVAGGKLEITAQEFDDRVRVNFIDNGKGIDKKHLDNIFLPFQRYLNRSDNSKGVGLALARALCMAMQGEIGVFSELGKGSTFWIELPVAHGTQPEAVPINPQGKATLLYIDDHVPNLKLLASMCRRIGDYAVYTFTDPQEGIKQAQKINPDIILLDLQIPQTSGQEIAEQMRQLDELVDTPIVAVSADETRVDPELFDDFLLKPLEPLQLKDIIQRQLQASNRVES